MHLVLLWLDYLPRLKCALKSFLEISSIFESIYIDIEKMSLASEEKLHRKEHLLNEYSLKAERIHTVQQLLKAYTLFDKDVE